MVLERMDARMHAQTDEQPKTNMPHQLLWSWGHKDQLYMEPLRSFKKKCYLLYLWREIKSYFISKTSSRCLCLSECSFFSLLSFSSSCLTYVANLLLYSLLEDWDLRSSAFNSSICAGQRRSYTEGNKFSNFVKWLCILFFEKSIQRLLIACY